MKKKIAYVIGAIVAVLIVVALVLILNNQKYVVTFDMQNGQPKFEQLVKRGNKVYEPSDPTREDYIFLGWYDGTELYDFTKEVKYNMTLVAKWEKGSYVKVSFETVGGNTIEPISVKKGSKVTRPIDPKKTGHTFKAWTLNGVTFDFETPITEDITLLATYEDVYSVYFDSNGGSAVASGTLKGGKIAKPEDPTKSGYKFLGWYLEDKAYDFNSEVKENMTLKAKWQLISTYISPRTAADNEKLIGLTCTDDGRNCGNREIYDAIVKIKYPINKIVVGATKPTTGVVKSEDWSLAKDSSVKAYIVKSGSNYDLLIAAEDTKTIINLPSDSSNLFANFYADSISFDSNVNAKTVTNMSNMFVSTAWTINLKNLDTSNVTNMSGMFRLEERLVDTSTGEEGFQEFDKVSAAKISRFYFNGKLSHNKDYVRAINGLSDLNVSKVTDMSYMFYGLNSGNIDLSKWNTSNVTKTSNMFAAVIFDSLNVTNLKFPKLTEANMTNMFGCIGNLYYGGKDASINKIINNNSDLTGDKINSLWCVSE